MATGLTEMGKEAFLKELSKRGIKANVDALNIQVKRGNTWPECYGPHGRDLLVLIDCKKYKQIEYYMLTLKDWKEFVETQIRQGVEKGLFKPEDVKVEEHHVPRWSKQACQESQEAYIEWQEGGGYNVGPPPMTIRPRGMTVEPEQISEHRNRWDKIQVSKKPASFFSRLFGIGRK